MKIISNEQLFRQTIKDLERKKKRIEILPGNIYISISPSDKLCWWLCKEIINKNECYVEWFSYLKDDTIGEIPDPEKHKTIVHNGKALYFTYNSMFYKNPPRIYSEATVIDMMSNLYHSIHETMLNLLFAAKKTKDNNGSNNR